MSVHVNTKTLKWTNSWKSVREKRCLIKWFHENHIRNLAVMRQCVQFNFHRKKWTFYQFLYMGCRGCEFGMPMTSWRPLLGGHELKSSNVCGKVQGPPRSHRPRLKAIPTAKTQPAQPRRRWALARELGKPRYALRHRGQRSKTRKCVLSFSWGRNYFIWYNYR